MNGLLNARKREATIAARFRGHTMKPWLSDGRYSHTECSRCDMGITVTTNPQPNEATIMGRAVALECSARVEGQGGNNDKA